MQDGLGSYRGGGAAVRRQKRWRSGIPNGGNGVRWPKSTLTAPAMGGEGEVWVGSINLELGCVRRLLIEESTRRRQRPTIWWTMASSGELPCSGTDIRSRWIGLEQRGWTVGVGRGKWRWRGVRRPAGEGSGPASLGLAQKENNFCLFFILIPFEVTLDLFWSKSVFSSFKFFK
jgi:hypothetical protein